MKKRNWVNILLMITIILMIVVTVAIYYYCTQPLYYYNIDGSYNKDYYETVFKYFADSPVWLVVPALVCVLLIVSVKFAFIGMILSFISGVLTFVFAFASSPGLIDRSSYFWGYGAEMLNMMLGFAILLCGIRFVIGIIQIVKLHYSEFE